MSSKFEVTTSGAGNDEAELQSILKVFSLLKVDHRRNPFRAGAERHVGLRHLRAVVRNAKAFYLSVLKRHRARAAALTYAPHQGSENSRQSQAA